VLILRRPGSPPGLGTTDLIQARAEPSHPDASPATTAAVIQTLRMLARRVSQLVAESRDLHQQMGLKGARGRSRR
jgi:hypothetical protein